MHRRILGLSLLALLVAFALGCKKDKDKDDKDGKGGVEYKTPEEAFEAFKTAAKDKDHKKFMNCLTPESQEQMAAMLVFSASFMSGFAEMDKTGEAKKKMKPIADVMEKHGLTEEVLKKQPEVKPGKEDPAKAMKPLLDLIKDKPAFCVDMLTAMDQTGQKGGFSEGAASATLKDVKIDGDTATGKVSSEKKKDEPIEFKKIGNSWKIDLTKMMK
jgi:hypothetical protein